MQADIEWLLSNIAKEGEQEGSLEGNVVGVEIVRGRIFFSNYIRREQ